MFLKLIENLHQFGTMFFDLYRWINNFLNNSQIGRNFKFPLDSLD